MNDQFQNNRFRHPETVSRNRTTSVWNGAYRTPIL